MRYVMGRFNARAALVAGATLMLSMWGAVQAQVVVGQDTFQVTANVLGACSVQANNLDFGSYAQGSLINVDAQSTIGVVCPAGTAFELGLDPGLNAPGLLASRTMTGGNPAGTQLDYELFTDAARTIVWGDQFGVDTQAGVGAAPAAVTFDVFGRIPAGQSPNPGAFADTVSALVFF